MSIILDLHIHSRFSRACSPQLTQENIDEACRIKGVDIISSGDFTFPNWYKSLQSDLEETAPGSGLYRYHKSLDNKVSFLIGTEVSLVYRDGNKAMPLT
jgi:PHP family Zn ribbon phosphoesterase